jgi:tetratricopeptide (TPR) repeat protein
MGNVQEQIKQAKALERAQNGAAALESLLRLTQEPGPHAEDPGFWLHLADLARRTSSPEPAVRGYTRAIELLSSAGSPNNALAVARRLARVAPDAADAHLRHGRIAVELGYGVEARDAFLRAADAAPANGDLDTVLEGLRVTWSLLEERGLTDAAEPVRARMLELRPGADPANGAAPAPPSRQAAAAPAAPPPPATPAADADSAAADAADRLPGLEDFLPGQQEPKPAPPPQRAAPGEDAAELPPLELDHHPESEPGDELPPLELERPEPMGAGDELPPLELERPEPGDAGDELPPLDLERPEPAETEELPPLDRGGTPPAPETPALEGIGAALDDLDWPDLADPGAPPASGPPGGREPEPEPDRVAPGDDDLLLEPPADQSRELRGGQAAPEGATPRPEPATGAGEGEEEDEDEDEDTAGATRPGWMDGLDDLLGAPPEPAARADTPSPASADDELDAISPPGETVPADWTPPEPAPLPPPEQREQWEEAPEPREPRSTREPEPPQAAEPEPERAPEPEPPRERQPEPPPPLSVEGEYIDLAALILGDEEDGGTRFLTDAASPPTGDEERDFAEILDIFRRKVSEKIHPQDSSSHYDLGVAYKEMGLLDDAIGQLQLALRAGANPVATLEVIGECFLEKDEAALAKRVLERAAGIPGATDQDLVGVLYWLGRCEEILANPVDARGHYERVIAVDISFRDAAERLKGLRGRPR